MAKDAASGLNRYHIKLLSGRVLGPLDVDRIKKLIQKNQITGQEIARAHPVGEWQDINRFPELAELMLTLLQRKLEPPAPDKTQATQDILERAAAEADPMATTVQIAGTHLLPGAPQALGALQTVPENPVETPVPVHESPPSRVPEAASESQNNEATLIAPMGMDLERTYAEDLLDQEYEDSRGLRPIDLHLHQEKTLMIPRGGSKGLFSDFRATKGPDSKIRKILVGILLLLVTHEILFSGEAPRPQFADLKRIKPVLPSFDKANADPDRGQKLLESAVSDYLEDTVTGYKKAARKLLLAATLDIQNVKSLALLASSYLNLVDSSNKDERYFSTISKLIELSRAKSIDLPETIIADVEFYVSVNKPDAAENRIVEYTKTHSFGLEMFYYLGFVYFNRGDFAAAARYLSQIPDAKAFSPKIFYLKGQVAEKLGSDEQALAEYKKGAAFGKKNHAKSYLKIAETLDRMGKLGEAEDALQFLASQFRLLSPPDLGAAYYIRSRYFSLLQNWDRALGEIEKAAQIQPDNHDYQLELYTLRGRAGAKVESVRGKARMFYFLSEGERQLKQGAYEDALALFLQARQADDRSPLPFEKIGDTFKFLNNIENARDNYKKAALRSKKDIDLWSKYIETLIQSFDWAEAQRAIALFSGVPDAASSIDKLAGDMYAKQGLYNDALAFYRKSMSYSRIDSRVYVAYADSLSQAGNCKEAPMFYSLARRFDPLNMDAIVGTARCVSKTESVARAIGLLEVELQKTGGSRAELLAASAELEMQRGNWVQAQSLVKQAQTSNPGFSYPWKLQAQIFLQNQDHDRKAIDRALDAYKSYSDRNPSDPSGYLERYHIFIKQSKFDLAQEELNRIYTLYPKYPNLHYYKGYLYNSMGNYKASIEEFEEELKNHPSNVTALVAMGKSLIEVGAAQKAIDHLSRAMALAPALAEAKHYAGYANFLLKNYAGAIALYRAAIQIDSGNPLIFKRLGAAYLEVGDRMAAATAFRKYLDLAPDAPDRSAIEQFL